MPTKIFPTQDPAKGTLDWWALGASSLNTRLRPKTHGAGVAFPVLRVFPSPNLEVIYSQQTRKSTPYLGAYHGSDVPMFFPANTSVTDSVATDALVNFINTLDPNLSAAPADSRKNLSIIWPKWHTPSTDGSSSTYIAPETPQRQVSLADNRSPINAPGSHHCVVAAIKDGRRRRLAPSPTLAINPIKGAAPAHRTRALRPQNDDKLARKLGFASYVPPTMHST
ncbi:hypothetical protein DFH09DRAFT_1084841 [Mycena vulgaris]|nr:hypothetical protein DFH09DRAFT_1084841 [Mycena vulgaris]